MLFVNLLLNTWGFIMAMSVCETDLNVLGIGGWDETRVGSHG